jgi:predicted metal-binding protein
MARKIAEKVPQRRLRQDLEKYRARALELGATDARIITTDMVVIDERVRAKCMFPRCHGYGTNANCPPHTMDLDQVQKTVDRYHYAIFTRVEAPSEEMAGPEARARRSSIPFHRKTHEIVSRIEGEAFADGYHLALGFGSGSCKGVFCPEIECQALTPGQACRHSLRARSSMEAVGMDVYTMATRAGWDIYPIGISTAPSAVPFGASYGLVLVD